MPHPAVTAAASAPDFGNWADRLSGAAGLCAVIVALIVAGIEAKRAKRSEDARLASELKTLAMTREHVLKVTRRLVTKAEWLILLLDNPQKSFVVQSTEYPAWLELVVESERRILRIQSFPAVPLQMYLFCDDIVTELRKRTAIASLNSRTQVALRTVVERIKNIEIEIVGNS